MSSSRHAPRHRLTGLFRHRRHLVSLPAMIPAPVADSPDGPAPGTIWGVQAGTDLGRGDLGAAANHLRVYGVGTRDGVAPHGVATPETLAALVAEAYQNDQACERWPDPAAASRFEPEPERRDTAGEITITWDRPADLMVSRPQARLTRPYTDPAVLDGSVTVLLERSKVTAAGCTTRMRTLAYPPAAADRAQWEAVTRQIDAATGTRGRMNLPHIMLAPASPVIEPTRIWTPQWAPVRGRAIEAGTGVAA